MTPCETILKILEDVTPSNAYAKILELLPLVESMKITADNTDDNCKFINNQNKE